MKTKNTIYILLLVCLICLSSCNTGGTGDISSAAAKGETAASSLVQSENESNSLSSVKKESSDISTSSTDFSNNNVNVSVSDAKELITLIKEIKTDKAYLYDYLLYSGQFSGFREHSEIKDYKAPVKEFKTSNETREFLNSLNLDKWQHQNYTLENKFISFALYISENLHINLIAEHKGIYWASIATPEITAFYSIPKVDFDKLSSYRDLSNRYYRDTQASYDAINKLIETDFTQVRFFNKGDTIKLKHDFNTYISTFTPITNITDSNKLADFKDYMQFDVWQPIQWDIKSMPDNHFFINDNIVISYGPISNGMIRAQIEIKDVGGGCYVIPRSVYYYFSQFYL